MEINFVRPEDCAEIAAGYSIKPILLYAEEQAELAEKLEPALICYTTCDENFAGVIVYEGEDQSDVDCFVIRTSDRKKYLLLSSYAAETGPIATAVITTDAFVRAEMDDYEHPFYEIPDDAFEAAVTAAQAAQVAAQAAKEAATAAAAAVISLDRLYGQFEQNSDAEETANDGD